MTNRNNQRVINNCIIFVIAILQFYQCILQFRQTFYNNLNYLKDTAVFVKS